MQLYLYSCQDLIIKGASVINLSAGEICCLKFDKDETADIYCASASGVMLINERILESQRHNQIAFHKLNNEALLCEIKPFVLNENIHQHLIKGANLKLIENIDSTYIYFNGAYYGCVNQNLKNVVFEKREKDRQEYGILQFGGEKRYIIIFNSKQILYCNQFIDCEIKKDYAQMYTHMPNIFNVGVLTKCEFATSALTNKTVCDRGEERKQINIEFNIIYFLEALKCKRFKYAHTKLSYELRVMIDIDTLSKYFVEFDNYIYIQQQDTYVTLKNNKVVGIYHFVVKDNLIENIY